MGDTTGCKTATLGPAAGPTYEKKRVEAVWLTVRPTYVVRQLKSGWERHRSATQTTAQRSCARLLPSSTRACSACRFHLLYPLHLTAVLQVTRQVPVQKRARHVPRRHAQPTLHNSNRSTPLPHAHVESHSMTSMRVCWQRSKLRTNTPSLFSRDLVGDPQP